MDQTNMTRDPAREKELLISDTVAIVAGAGAGFAGAYAGDVKALIKDVYKALAEITNGEVVTGAIEVASLPQPKPVDAASLIGETGIKSLIDGKVYKSLRRHLTAHGYTPEAYRAKFGLPADFPMVSQAYSEQRSALAKAAGLGKRSDVEHTAAPV